MPEANGKSHGAARSAGPRAGLGAERYLELFQKLTPLIGSLDKGEICLRACELIAEMLGVEACSLMLLGVPDRHTLRLAAATHIPTEEWPAVELPLDHGVCGTVLREGTPLMVSDAGELRAHLERKPDGRYRSASFAIVPLFVRGRPEGVINVANPLGRRIFRQRDLDLLNAAAGLIGGALESAMRAQEAQQLHKNLEDIFDSMEMGILSVNSDGQLTHSNHRVRMMFGLTSGNGMQPYLSQVLPGNIYNICRRLMREAGQDGQPTQDRMEVELFGRQVFLEITVSRMRYLGGVLSESLLIFEDVGQDEEVKRLRESENMKRSFLSIISHELRTPLAVIRGALPLIDPGQASSVAADSLRQVHVLMLKNCHRLNEVVNSILDVTEIENGTLQLVLRQTDLNNLLTEVVELQKEIAGHKSLTIDSHIMNKTLELQADRPRLRQVLSELISNAIKFSSSGGLIGVSMTLNPPWVEIQITNHGARIDPCLRKRIFEKFSQGDQTLTRAAGGCGIGLFLVQNIIRLHGGQVELLDKAEDETTFIVRLPLGSAAAA